MRSSNCKHYAKKEKKSKASYAKVGSLVFAVVIAISAITIPSTTMIQNVEAITSARNSAFNIGGTETFSNVIVESYSVKKDNVKESNKTEKKESVSAKKQKATVAKETAPVETTAPATTEATVETTVAPTTVAPTTVATQPATTMTVAKSKGLLSVISADPNYTPQHISLTSDQRDILERLVMGEAGTLGYTGCALVAQAVRDSMALSGTTSVESIISEYQYTAPLDRQPNSSAKNAVSYIFDNDGYAVQHRILYFYASNVVSNPWHESQNFIVSYGNVRFFDKW